MKLPQLIPAAALASAMLVPTCFGQHYDVTKLVGSDDTLGAKVTDSGLKDAWGLSRGSQTPWWVVETGSGAVKLFTGTGTAPGLTVTVKGGPVGTIFNGGKTDFLMAPGEPALFLFSTFAGTINGWNPKVGLTKGQTTSTVAPAKAQGKKGSSYTGLTSATVNGETYLYAANFALGTVDVFNAKFKPWTFTIDSPYQQQPFFDDLLPAGYVPYNVQAVGNDIVVTYGFLKNGFPEGGDGLGYVDIYSADGYLLQRLEHGEWLNAPWGVALAPTDFGKFSHALLIGNFANGQAQSSGNEYSGTIAAYDLATGSYLGELDDPAGKWISIEGLWALSPAGNVPTTNSDPAVTTGSAEIYFTAGPNGGSKGLFGYLTAASTDLLQGNDQ